MSRGHFKGQPVLVPWLFFRLVLCCYVGRGKSTGRGREEDGKIGIREKLTWKANHTFSKA
jgi:hypothetical protein